LAEKIKPAIGEVAKMLTRQRAEISHQQIDNMIKLLMASRSVFVTGAGGSGLVSKSLAMRLTHLGFSTNIVGDQTAKAFTRKDVLIAISHTGETLSTTSFAREARRLGGRIVAITSSANSSLTRLADSVVQLAAGDEKYPILAELGERFSSGMLFEVNALAFVVALTVELLPKTGQAAAQLERRHAVLE
jgi:6-phospho 3-hexuloisomerase